MPRKPSKIDLLSRIILLKGGLMKKLMVVVFAVCVTLSAFAGPGDNGDGYQCSDRHNFDCYFENS